MRYRLGLDVGATSLGWWIWEENEDGEVIRAVDGGVRIFSDGRVPKSGTSLAQARRTARGARRRRDRYLKRRARLMSQLVGLGLMPKDETKRKELEKKDPYVLRARAIKQPIAAFELGRALFHLNQRRGFKSNRIADGGNDERDSGKIRSGINELDGRLSGSGCQTIGEFLAKNYSRKRSLRFRPGTDFYPSRKHYEDEFELIRECQEDHQSLSSVEWDELKKTIFHQRPLRPVDPGRCTLFPDEDRAAEALPISQRFRILQEVTSLKLIVTGERDRFLDQRERRAAIDLLLAQKTVTFNTLRKKLGLRLDSTFNLESERRKQLDGDKTAVVLSREDFFGKAWRQKSLEFQMQVVGALVETQSEAEIENVAKRDWSLNQIAAKNVAGVRLSQGYSRLSKRAMNALVPEMEQGLLYYEAVSHAFPKLSHSAVDRHVQLDKLPYYPELLERHVSRGSNDPADDVFKRLGRIANPTVHIGLNQLRRVLNAIVHQYGHPNKIVVELTRDLKSSKAKKDENRKREAKEQAKNEQRQKDLKNCGVAPSPDYLRRLRLWEEQGPPQARCCPYCAKTISLEMVLDARTQIDHILPFSRTLDDSFANKVICCQACNQVKRNRSPAEAFGYKKGGPHDYEKMLLRANSGLPGNKKWRFERDAMERYKEVEEGFLDRHLNDTSYLARMAKTYVQSLCESPAQVSVTPGHLTGLLRGKWGLNDILSDSNFKNRSDHRHHAVDAAVIALIDRTILRRVSTAAAKGAEANRLIADVPEPLRCPGFRDQIRHRVRNVIVVHRPNHSNHPSSTGTTGQLHNDSAHGVVGGPDKRNSYTVVRRVALRDLSPQVLSGSDKRTIVDECLRQKLLGIWNQFSNQDKTWIEFCEQAARRGLITRDGVRRVRCKEHMTAPILVADADGRPYKAYKGDSNAYTEIFKLSDGKFRAEAVGTFDANRKRFVPKWRSEGNDATLVMRLHINDLVAIGKGPSREILRVVKLSKQNITCAHAHEGGALKKRDADRDDPFKYVSKSASSLMADGLRRIGVDDLGTIYDSGPIVQ